MANDKVYLVVMVASLDSPLAIQNYLGGLGGPGEFESPRLRSNGWLVKIMFTFLGTSLCKFTNFVPLGVYGLDLTPSTIWTSADTNITSVIIIIDLGIATKYIGIYFTSSILKLVGTR